MALEFMYITNNPEIGCIAEEAGVERIWIDLEVIGKQERQPYESVKSKHKISDIETMKKVLHKSCIQVRVNPVYEGLQTEIDNCIKRGADIIMLPYFKSVREVDDFLGFVNGRAKTNLLVETKEAVENLDKILNLGGIDEVHIGLNDLHLSYNKKFMFELLTDGTVETICKKIEQKGISYGFGGIASIGKGTIPAELIISEHIRLNSNRVILSRSFANEKDYEIDKIKFRYNFIKCIKEIYQYQEFLKLQEESYFIKNQFKLKSMVDKVVKCM